MDDPARVIGVCALFNLKMDSTTMVQADAHRAPGRRVMSDYNVAFAVPPSGAPP